MWANCGVTSCFFGAIVSGFSCRAGALPINGSEYKKEITEKKKKKKKVIVVGSGWAGLSAAHHLSKQGFDVTVLEDHDMPGPRNSRGTSADVGIHGFWRSYRNIFSFVDELGLKPFTNWEKSAVYSPDGLEIEFPIFQDLTQLPSPLGILFYTQHQQLPLLDRLTALPLMAAAIDFDNSEAAWRKYDLMTARELFKQFGCSNRLYRKAFSSILQVSLFAQPEQCSAAAVLAALNYYIITCQGNFDFVCCRGTIQEKIFKPWLESFTDNCGHFIEVVSVTDFSINEETESISEVVCGEERFAADAVILAVGISRLQQIIMNSSVFKTREEFLKVLNLDGISVLTVRLLLDRKVNIPSAVNACSGFEDSSGWTFFDLNAIHDEYKDVTETVIEVNFYNANHLLPLEDNQIVVKVMCCLSKFNKEFKDAIVLRKEIGIHPKSLTHYFPGSYKYMMRGTTTIPNLFMAGDWIVTRHGSWAQEKAFVTGLEAANRVVDYLEEGNFAKIIPVVEDEPHVQFLRSFVRNINEIRAQLPSSDFFL